MSSRPTAVVVGTGLTALGVTRSLAREGIPVRHLPPGPSGPLGASRWYRPLVDTPWPGVEDDPGQLEDAIEGSGLSRVVLFPCSDASVMTVASAGPSFTKSYAPYLADSDVLARLIDKRELAELAERLGVPIPETVPVRSQDDLEDLDAAWFRDALLKPVDSLRFFRRFGVKSLPVSSREQARHAYRQFDRAGLESVLQRYVPGPPSAHLFMDGYRSGDGELVGRLMRRRERMYPPKTGNSSSMVTVPPGDSNEAEDSLRRIFRDVRFRGIFSAEFKEDAEDGTLRLLEINVRPWWYVEFAARCGVNVCAMAYREASGASLECSEHYEVGRRCVYSYYDFYAGWSELKAGRLSPWEWMGTWIGSDRPVFARDDPLPAVRVAWQRARQSLRSRLGGAGFVQVAPPGATENRQRSDPT